MTPNICALHRGACHEDQGLSVHENRVSLLRSPGPLCLSEVRHLLQRILSPDPRFRPPCHRTLPARSEGIFAQLYREAHRRHLAGHTVRCILNENDLCSIYDHPLRPEVCDLYPFSFKSGDLRCPAYREHLYLVKVLTSGRRGFILYDSSFCPNPDPRPMSEQEHLEILCRFLGAGPSLGVVRAFAEINGLSIPFLVRTMHDTHLTA